MKKSLPLFISFIFTVIFCANYSHAQIPVEAEKKLSEVKPNISAEVKNDSVPTVESQSDNNVPAPLNKDVRYDGEEQMNKIFRNMVVVQRKAKNKAKHFLFNPIVGLDFSDGPATFYTLNTNFGYAFSDFWELYVNYAPKFFVQERGIVKKIRSLTLANNKQAEIYYERPQSQYGVEVVYAPAYGKESWGPNTIFRSDTFFKFGASQVNFETGLKGMRYAFMLGKTFFVDTYFNTRMDAGIHYVQTFVDGETKFTPLLFVEAGLVFYF
jgi:outer membrane beta-barrel protein